MDNDDVTISNPVVLTVITPVGPGSERWLPEAAQSIEDARVSIRDLGELEWAICWDGTDATDVVGANVQVAWTNQSGVAAARNAALAHASGEWVFPLDADDLLEPDGIRLLLDVCLSRSDIQWAGANRILVDGAKTPHWFEAERTFPVGSLAQDWRAPFPFHPNTLLVRRELLSRVGGWPALPVNEDLGLALALSEEAAGISVPITVMRYRPWKGQLTNDGAYVDNKRMAFSVIASQLNARRNFASRTPIASPTPGPAFGRLPHHRGSR